VITGGEPFLRNDIFDILKYAHDLDLNIEVVSNGSLITQDIAENIMSCGLSNIANFSGWCQGRNTRFYKGKRRLQESGSSAKVPCGRQEESRRGAADIGVDYDYEGERARAF